MCWIVGKTLQVKKENAEHWSSSKKRLDSWFVARIGKKRRVQEDRRRKPRASVKGRGERAQRGVDFSHWPGAWDGAVYERPRTSRLLRVFIGDQSDSAAISHYQHDIFVKLDFRVRKPATLSLPSPPRSSSPLLERVSRSDRLVKRPLAPQYSPAISTFNHFPHAPTRAHPPLLSCQHVHRKRK